MRQNFEDSRGYNFDWMSGRFGETRKVLAGDIDLEAAGPLLHFYDAGGSDRRVDLPPNAGGRFFAISNVGATGELHLYDHQNDLIVQVEPAQSTFIWSSRENGEWMALRAWSDLDVFGPVGPNHRRGLVPDPGATPNVGVRLLGDDAEWHSFSEVPVDEIDAFKVVTDGTTSATAEGLDAFKIRCSDSTMFIAVGNNDATHGDNVNLRVNPAAVDHNALLNYVADRHVAHGDVSMAAGEGLTGGGTIAATRSFALDIPGLTSAVGALGNSMVYHNGSNHRKMTLSQLNGILAHDSLLGYSADRHVAHSGVSIIAGNGLTGGGGIDASRTLSFNIQGMPISADAVPAAADYFPFYDASEGNRRISYENLSAAIRGQLPTDWPINVKAAPFNAAGDNSTNDTAAIQAAIDYVRTNFGKGKLMFPPGIYRAQGITFYPGIYFTGMGSEASIVRCKASPTANVPVFNASKGGAVIFEYGGFENMSVEGPGTGDENEDFIPGNGTNPTEGGPGTITVDCISFKDLDEESQGFRLRFYWINNVTCAQGRTGLYLAKNVYRCFMNGCNFTHNDTGVWVSLQHPEMMNCNMNYNDVGLDGGLVIDWPILRNVFSLNRIGINVPLERCQLIGCVLYQNSLLGVRIANQTQMIGCLVKRPEGNTPTPRPDNIQVILEGRQNLVSTNVFFGAEALDDDTDKAIIALAGPNTVAHPFNQIANNWAWVNGTGPFIRKIASRSEVLPSDEWSIEYIDGANPGAPLGKGTFGNTPQLSVVNNQVLIQSIGDGTLGMFLDVPSGAGELNNPSIIGNNIRINSPILEDVEGDADMTWATPIINVQVTTNGHTTCFNTITPVTNLGGNAHVTTPMSFSDSTTAIVIGNRFKALAPHTIGKPSFGTTTNAHIRNNHGFVTENRFLATMTGESQSFAHGLDLTPETYNFFIQPRENMTNNPSGFWVTAVDATNVTIRRNGASDTIALTVHCFHKSAFGLTS